MDEDKLKEEDWLKEVSRSIGEQIEQEEKKDREEREKQQFPNGSEKSGDINNLGMTEGNAEEAGVMEALPKKKWGWKKKLLVVLCTLCVIAGGAGVFVYAMLDQIKQDDTAAAPRVTTDLTDEQLKEQQETMVTPSFDTNVESKVINILLIGEEAMNDDLGRSDSTMIATINTEEKSLKLTSIMRDTYVSIPGYMDNKLNAAYHNGGGALLTETIEQNFNIKIDGYVRVDYEGFENAIDRLGGVDVDISESEASYLNSTNYISDPSNRNLTAGLQTLNGNQALGYCRVRYRKASNGEANDFGRTYRQRTVLNALFNKYKSTSLVNMISIAQEMLSNYVSTNMSKTEMIQYLTAAASLGTTELETSRIPVDGTYTCTELNCGGTYRSVLQIDKEANQEAIRKFIYAGLDEEDLNEEVNEDEEDTTTESSTDSTSLTDSSNSDTAQ